jgi:TonB family protein
MLEPRPSRRRLRAASWSVLAAIAVLCAFSAPLPGEPVTIPLLVDPPRLVVHPETELPPLAQDTSAPRLLNGAEVQENARRFYPPLVRDAGISGTPMIWVHVDETGVVRSTRVSAPSTHKALDEAALKVAGTMRFAPAQFRGRAVSKWIEVGVEFKSDRAAPPETGRAQTPEPVLYSVKPGMKNVADVTQAMQRFYPPLLRDAGVGGTAVVWLFVEETGEVTKAQLRRSTGHQALDEAAIRVAEVAVFTPAFIREKKTTSWVELPVTFADGAVQLGSYDVTITGLDEEKRRIEQIREEARARAENRMISEIEAAPTFTPYTVKPEMVNTAEVVRMMQRVYPPLLRDAGIGGKILVWFLIDEQGEVIKTQVKKGSGHVALDEAAIQVAEMVKFTPALNRDQKVKVWIELPIEFKTQ